MKTILSIAGILLAASANSFAQPAVAGTWRVDGAGPLPWTVMLSLAESELIGTVSHCASRGALLPAQIFEARIIGSTVGFKCKSVDERRTLTFTGVISGDEMTLNWEQQVQADAAPIDDLFGGMFGPSTPPRFVAKRVRDSGVELAAAVNLLHKGVKVEGTLFLPTQSARVRSVLVLINSGTSWNGLARSLYDNPEMRTLSATLESSLLLLRITNISQSAGMYFVSSAGAGAADGLLMLLDRLATDAGRPELANAPLLLWGHSAAGVFGPTFAALHPDRTIACVVYHSGPPSIDIRILARLPVLLLVGGRDQAAERFDGRGRTESFLRDARVIGAPWTYGLELNATHQDPADLEKANALLIPWISAVVRQRVSPDGGRLRVVTDGSAWLGDNRTGTFASYGAFPGSKPEASWLPDETTARGWQVVLGLR